jgi:hypothetical protein
MEKKNNLQLEYSEKNEIFTQLYTPVFIIGLVPVKIYTNALISKPDIIKKYKNNTIIYM